MCAQVVFRIEGLGKFLGLYRFAAARRVDKFAVADIEADVGIFVRSARAEKYQITGFQFAVGDLREAAAMSRAVRGRLTPSAFL